MVRLRVFAFVVSLLVWHVEFVSSLYANQAGVIDWHHQYIGTPKTSFFHKFVSRGAYVLVASDRNVLASINVRSGNLDWRQVFDENENILAFKGYESVAISVSKRDHDYIVRSWESHSGFMLWENRIKDVGVMNSNPSIEDDDAPGVEVVFAADNLGVLALLEGTTVVNLNFTDGNQIWRSDITDSSTVLYKLVEFEQKVYGVGLKKSIRSYTIEVNTYNISNGILKTQSLSSKIDHIKDMIVLGGTTQNGFIIWKEENNMRVNRLDTTVIEQAPLEALYGTVIPSFANANGKLELHDLNLESRTEFLVQVPTNEGNTAAVFKVDPVSGRLLVLYDFEEKPENSVYSATFDKSERLIISRSRITAEDVAKVDIIAPEPRLVLGSYEMNYSLNSYGDLKKSVLDVDSKATGYRMLVISADGSMHFWKDHEVVWKSEESLAHTIEAEFLDLPERKLWTQEVDELAEQPEEAETISPLARYIRRVRTHIEQLKDLPAYLIAYAQRFITGDYEVEPIQLARKSKISLHRDTFGFRKLLIFVTRTKLIALDTNNKGQIVWSRYFGNDIFEFNKIFVVRSSTVKYPPLVVAIGTQKDLKERIVTRLFRLNALTGENFIPTENKEHFPSELSIPIIIKRILKLPIEEPDERTHIIALIDEELKARSLKGYHVENNVQPFDVTEVWSFGFPEGESIAAIGHRPQHEKVASLGRVLGDRSVLYKYLNPHLIAVATLSTSTNPTSLNVYLIDTVKGSILHHAIHENVGSSQPVRIAQIENLVVYHFWSENFNEKGYVVVVYELYESETPDQRFESPVFTSFAHERPYVSAQAYMFPYGVNAIGITTTKHGIATREFLFALDTNQVFGISKRILDPRRPQRALTSEDKEEMLIPYDPAIPDNKKWVLSYHLSIAGIKNIITSPALLESTSLVLVYGLDLWFTREAPSKTFDVLSEDFSKGTLLITIFGLILGILITKPMVRKKKVNSRWY
ncbi:14657_t:CDS:10 [Funneliformis caledonium]|uniref:ER membrane protein complex subunit 1 n=1 Tax=Funneliformis caledonium TaxID=1117310 RepID=A0A9N9GW53_9GLOM|nr:14657_t:CDS:10 [Funneliformis caledonium]